MLAADLVYRVAHNTATSKVLRPRTNAPNLVTLDDSLESVAAAASEDEVIDRCRALGQQQASEEQMMPLDEIRTKAERLETKTRRWRLMTAVLLILLLIKGGVEVWSQTEALERAGDLLLMAALVYIAYRYRRRLTAPPVALGTTYCREFYRAELVRQRDLSKDSWGFLLPFVPGMALAVFGSAFESRPAGQLIAIIALSVALFLGVAWWNAYAARKLQNE